MPFFAVAQPGYMKDGKVYEGNEVYCYYRETGKKISTMQLQGTGNVSNPLAYPEANNDEFRDYIFGDKHRDYITARAKVLASAHQVFMIYFYEISIQGINRKLNVKYHPMLIRLLAQDMVKYDVIQNGFLNEKNAIKLFEKWQDKSSVIKNSELQKGVVNNYNSETGKVAERPATINIKVVGDKIYRDDSLFARYELDKHLPGIGLSGSAQNSNLYKIEDMNGNLMAWVSVPMLRSVFFLTPAGEEEALSIVTTDRDEHKIIASATKVLIVHNRMKQP